jgi:hypothetical protein
MRLMAALCSAITLVAITCPALAQNPDRVAPPAEFDRPFEGRLIKLRLDTVAEVRTACRTPLAMGLGCAPYIHPSLCVVVLASDEVIKAAGYSTEIVLRHEIAHCNGWPKDHPNSRLWVR